MPKKWKRITVPALIKKLGTTAIANGTGVSGSLPYKWLHGSRVSGPNQARLQALAKTHGYIIDFGGEK